jgi:hypothetical protein
MTTPARKRTSPANKAETTPKKTSLSQRDRALMAQKASVKAKDAAKEQRKLRFLELFEGAGCNISHTCKALGITRQTYLNWMKDDASFATSVVDLKQGLIDFAESMLMKKIKEGDNTATIFFLKCQAKDRGYIERLEHSGPNGSPISHRHGIDMEWLNEELPVNALVSIVNKLRANVG